MKDLIERQVAIDEVLLFLVEYCGAAFDEDMQNKLYQRLILLPSVQPEVGTCKTCDCQESCKHAQYLGNDGYCSHWEERRKDETD